MGTYWFTFTLAGPVDDATADAVYEAGLDDSALYACDGQWHIEVAREARSLRQAVASALHQAETAGVRVVRMAMVAPPDGPI